MDKFIDKNDVTESELKKNCDDFNEADAAIKVITDDKLRL